MRYSWSVRTTFPWEHRDPQRGHPGVPWPWGQAGGLSHPVIELHNQVVGGLIAAELQVHDAVDAQLAHAHQPPRLQVLPALQGMEGLQSELPELSDQCCSTVEL